MATSRISIELVASDKATPKIKALAAGLDEVDGKSKRVGSTWGNLKTAGLQFAAVLGTVTAAAYAGKKAYDATVGAVINYNKAILDASRATGTTAEDFSRIVQVADDFGISMGSVETALALATKNGFAPSVDSIASLADELNAIDDPTKRAAAAAKIFGRNWAALDPILQEGGKAIREMSAAVADGLVATDAEIKKTEEARLAIDKLSDTWTGLKNTVGLEAAPTITRVLTNMNDVLSGNITAWEGSKRGFMEMARILGLIPPEIDKSVSSLGYWEEQLRGMSGNVGMLADAFDALPTQKSFKYNMSIDMDSDMKELIRHMGWSAAALLFAGGQGFNIGAQGRTAIATAAASSFGAAQTAAQNRAAGLRADAATGGRGGGVQRGFASGGWFGVGDSERVIPLSAGEVGRVFSTQEINNSRNMTFGNVSINNGQDLSSFQSMLRRSLGGE